MFSKNFKKTFYGRVIHHLNIFDFLTEELFGCTKEQSTNKATSTLLSSEMKPCSLVKVYRHLSEMCVNFYHITRRHIPKDSAVHEICNITVRQWGTQ
jgi:hypothetical protein